MKSSTTTIKEQGRQSHRSYLHPGTYYSIFNDLGFFASSSIILFIITGMRLHPTVLMWITLVSTWIAISSMWIAYVVPFSTVSTQATKNKIYVTQNYSYYLLGGLGGWSVPLLPDSTHRERLEQRLRRWPWPGYSLIYLEHINHKSCGDETTVYVDVLDDVYLL